MGVAQGEKRILVHLLHELDVGRITSYNVCYTKLLRIKERTASIASPIRNAFIDFSKMTVSVAAVVTDVIRDGKPVVGYGFNSNGRYAQGCLLRERFLPRVREADPRTYVFV